MTESGDKAALLGAIAEATRLREGSEGVRAFIRVAYRDGPLPLRDLAERIRIPLPVVSAVRRELEGRGLLVRDQGIRLSPSGIELAENALGLGARLEATCSACGGRGITLDALGSDLLRDMREQVARGPTVDVTLDQAPCTAETALLRALAMYRAGAIEGRRILIGGDDDSVSVAIALLERALGIHSSAITVLEVDPKRLQHLADARERWSLPIELVAHDLRDPLPQRLIGAFDTYETDPPYTLDGLTLFISRGIEGLGEGTGKPVFLSYADLGADDRLALHRRLAAMGLAVLAVQPAFNRYEGASILGSVGQFMQLTTTAETCSLAPDDRHVQPIYTGEIRPRSRLYRCRSCGLEISVGTGASVQTIERLKETGCPSCGGTVFKRVQRGPAKV